jgi:predicted ATPase
MSKFLQAALEYAAAGWYVHPLRPGQKQPLTSHGSLDATIDPNTIRSWWTRWPNANIGIALKPSGLCALDIDTNDGKAGEQSFAQIDKEIPENVLLQTTARGGYHLIFAQPKDLAQQRIISAAIDGVTATPSHLDLLSDGYIVAAPSVTEHGDYKWAVNDDPFCSSITTAVSQPLSALPPILRTARAARSKQAQVDNATSTSEISSGSRNSQLFKLACDLHELGLPAQEVVSTLITANESRCNPPLPESEVRTIAESATERTQFDHKRLANELAKAALGDLDPDQIDPGTDPLADDLVGAISAKPTPFIRVYNTHFPALDKHLGGGLSTRQLTILCAGPGVGKTTFALSLAKKITTAKDGPPIVFFSTEIETTELAARLAAEDLDRPWSDLLKADSGISREQIVAVNITKKIYLFDRSKIPFATDAALKFIQRTIAQVTKVHGVAPIVILDYLQQISDQDDTGEKRGSVTKVVNALRAISQIQDCALFVISSSSRAGYGKALIAIREEKNARAYLSLGKESGDIEYAASALIFVDAEVIEDDPTKWEGVFAIAKSRHGYSGFVGVGFDAAKGIYWQREIVTGLIKKTDFKAQILDKITQHRLVWTRSDLARNVPGATRSMINQVVLDLISAHIVGETDKKLYRKEGT